MPRLTEELHRFCNGDAQVNINDVPLGVTDAAEWAWMKACENVGSIARNFPEANIPDQAVCFFKDGDKWCCVHGNFINLQESPAGFGDTFEEARLALQHDAEAHRDDPQAFLRSLGEGP